MTHANGVSSSIVEASDPEPTTGASPAPVLAVTPGNDSPSPEGGPAVTPQLSPDDISAFAKLGIPRQLLAEAGIQRVTDRQAREDFGMRFDRIKDLSGVVFPYYIPAVNHRVTARVRRDNPESEGGKLKDKYILAWGDGRHLYFPVGAAAKLRNPGTPIVIVESEKSALALTAWAERVDMDIAPLGMGGCWGWMTRSIRKVENARGERIDMPGPLADLSYCDARKVFVLLDANAATNPKVQRARAGLIAELRRRQCNVLVCDLPAVDVVNGPDDFIGIYGDAAMSAVFKAARVPEAGGWPPSEPLGGELPPVPSFDPELLPDALRAWVEDIAIRLQVPLDFPACAAMAALSAACMRRAMVQPKRLDTGWLVVPIVWGALIGEPGTKKTPTLNAIYRPLHKIEATWLAEYKDSVAEAADEAEKSSLESQAYRELYKQHLKSKSPVPEPSRPKVRTGSAPLRKRLISNDATFEAMSELLAANPPGVSIVRDELTGWLESFERQGREADRAFALESWGGHNPFTSSRIGRGETDVAHCAMGVFGGIQPNRLRNYLRGVQQDDGLFQRFQFLVWPDYPRDVEYVDAAPNEAAERTAIAVFERIAVMDAAVPLIFQFAPDAQKLFEEWLPQLDSRALNEDLTPVFRAHLAKYRSLLPTIALLLSLADDCLVTISLRHVQKAAAWCEFLEMHARRVYASQVSPEQIAAHALSRKLTSGWKRAEGCFSLRDAYRPQWTGLTTPDEARAALRILCEYGWVRKLDGARDTAGRPSETYEINPEIAEMK